LARFCARPNVHTIGVRSREELPAYLAELDCCLVPYLEGDWSRHGSPLKLWDYLYAGPPVVGSGYLALLEYPAPLVHFAVGAQGFVGAIERALACDGGRAERRAFALANTWQARAAQFEQLVGERAERTAGYGDSTVSRA
jgi:hypothetical protein